MRTAFIDGLITAASLDPRIMLVTGDLGFSVLEAFAEQFPERYLNVGVAEQNMTGIASGLAHSGKIVFTYSIANFSTLRCLEQIRNDVCYQNANVKIVSVGAGFSYGTQGYTHFGVEDIAIMRSLPNMKIFSPADAAETIMLVQQAISCNGPCYLRLGRANETPVHPDNGGPDPMRLPQIIPVMQSGNPSVILSTGAITAVVREFLTEQKVNCDLWSVPHIKPVDKMTLKEISTLYKMIYTVEEHQLSGGFGSAILESYEELQRQGQVRRIPDIRRIGIEDFIPTYIGSQSFMREKCIDLSLIKADLS